MVELINKYRPKTFDEVVGHDAVVKALKAALDKGTARTFLFTGPPGTGKTTLARILAKEAGCKPSSVVEIDAATNTGIDAMREVTSGMLYRPVGGTVTAIIVDEAHALSKAAAQSLLKILEEPPSWVLWMLCTTEPTRVLPSIKTRCMTVDLRPVRETVLEEWLAGIAKQEGLGAGKLKAEWYDAEGIIEFLVGEAGGSPRQALSNLALCTAAETLDEAMELLRTSVEAAEAVDLARLLTNGASWAEVQKVLVKLKDQDPESVRRIVQAYMTSVILGAKKESAAGRGLEILDAFSQPFYNMGGLVLACGKATLS